MVNCLHGQAPQYLVELCQPVAGVASRQHIRSAAQRLLVVPRHQLSSYGRRAFCVAGPSVWNSLPDNLRNPIIGGNSFRQSLKTFLFAAYWCIQRIRGFTSMRYINRLFTYFFYRCRGPRRITCVDLYDYRLRVWAWRGSNFGLLHWFALSPLQHSRNTVRVCDDHCIQWYSVNITEYNGIHCWISWQFCVPWQIQSSNGYCNPQLIRRVCLASTVMASLQRIWKYHRLSVAIEVRVYQSLVLSVLL